MLGMRLLVGHRRMARLRSSAIDAEPDVLVLCQRPGRTDASGSSSVLRTPFLSSPCLDGLRRPAILLPEDAEENLRETFVHELAHLARRDGLWNLLRHIATAVFWVQPLLWLLSKRLEETAEEVCDDYVVEFGADRCRYAGHLLELAERRLPPLAPSGVGMISLTIAPGAADHADPRLDADAVHPGRCQRAIAATLVAGLAGTLLVGLLGVGGRRSRRPSGTSRTARNASDRLAPSAPTTTQKPAPAERAGSTVPITGRIVDLEGRPVVGATVQVTQIRKPKGEQPGSLDRGGQAGRALDLLRPSDLRAAHHARGEAAHGHDRSSGPFPNRGPRRGKARRYGDPGPDDRVHAAESRDATDSADPCSRLPVAARSGIPDDLWVRFHRHRGPGRPVEGTIRDARTNQPLAGVEVQSDQFAGSDFVGTGDLKTTTDAQGRFRLVGLPKGAATRSSRSRMTISPISCRKLFVADPPGIAPVSVEIGLHRGIFIEGKVTEKATGQPVPKAWLQYFPFLDNTFAQATPEFASNVSVAASSSFQGRYQSKTDGSYRLVGLPGRAIIGVVVYSEKPYLQGAGPNRSKEWTSMGISRPIETQSHPASSSRLR